jgi:hypothetical protein
MDPAVVQLMRFLVYAAVATPQRREGVESVHLARCGASRRSSPF